MAAVFPSVSRGLSLHTLRYRAGMCAAAMSKEINISSTSARAPVIVGTGRQVQDITIENIRQDIGQILMTPSGKD